MLLNTGRLEHPRKAPVPIEVTELGILTEVKPVLPEKALFPIDVTEFGITTLGRLVQL